MRTKEWKLFFVSKILNDKNLNTQSLASSVIHSVIFMKIQITWEKDLLLPGSYQYGHRSCGIVTMWLHLSTEWHWHVSVRLQREERMDALPVLFISFSGGPFPILPGLLQLEEWKARVDLGPLPSILDLHTCGEEVPVWTEALMTFSLETSHSLPWLWWSEELEQSNEVPDTLCLWCSRLVRELDQFSSHWVVVFTTWSWLVCYDIWRYADFICLPYDGSLVCFIFSFVQHLLPFLWNIWM